MRACLGGSITKRNKEEMTVVVTVVVTSGEKEKRRGSGELALLCFLPWKVVA